MKIVDVLNAPKMKNRFKLDAAVVHDSPLAQAVHFTLKPGESIGLHPMTVDVFFYVLEGEGVFLYESSETPVSANHIVAIEKGAQRGWRNDSDRALRVMVVKTPRP